MQISLYIGKKRKKDRIVNEELSKFTEGDRSSRIKDLILKGLIFEGNKGIDEKLLDIRYMMGLNVEVKTVKNTKSIFNDSIKQEIKEKSRVEPLEQIQPDFKNIKIKNSSLLNDSDLEKRI
jgi:hypothetical protein